MQGWIFLRKKIYFSPWNLVILHDTCNIFVIIAKRTVRKSDLLSIQSIRTQKALGNHLVLDSLPTAQEHYSPNIRAIPNQFLNLCVFQ